MPSEKVSQEEVLRSAQFDLLRQLQKAVRTVILTATVSNSCVNCSHSLCGQLFRLIRSCLLAGCRRFHGAKLTEDFLFLLVVPEFVGAFKYDLEFIAHLCVSHNVGSFVRQLFEDSRANHFYCDCAIMRDEELHLAFVSSLMALEPVNFHPDSPDLAQQCLSASLDNLRLIPVQWIFEGSGKLEDHVPASRPDKALDVIASLEGLWMDSRKDTARRLMRASISSMTSQNSVSSTSSLQGHATAMPHLLRLESSHSGNISDSDSESSSRQSVSTSTSITGSQAEKLPPFMSHGVHLEWKLKMHPRPPKDVQVSRQRGLCPECRERLPSSLFHGPRCLLCKLANEGTTWLFIQTGHLRYRAM